LTSSQDEKQQSGLGHNTFSLPDTFLPQGCLEKKRGDEIHSIEQESSFDGPSDERKMDHAIVVVLQIHCHERELASEEHAKSSFKRAGVSAHSHVLFCFYRRVAPKSIE
jgi:hypothetical protein